MFPHGEIAGRAPAPPPIGPVDFMVYAMVALVIVVFACAGGFGLGFAASWLITR